VAGGRAERPPNGIALPALIGEWYADAPTTDDNLAEIRRCDVAGEVLRSSRDVALILDRPIEPPGRRRQSYTQLPLYAIRSVERDRSARDEEQPIVTHQAYSSTVVGAGSFSQQTDSAIQSLRGLAVILMVCGHVIGSTATAGMQVADKSAWRLFYLALKDIRMPLFTVISGFVYAMRPISRIGDVPGLLSAKIRRLLFPLITVGALMFLLEFEVPGTHNKEEPSQFWKIYVLPYEHLWFLQALFLVFVIVAVVDAVRLLSSRSRALLAIVVSSVMAIVISVPLNMNVFSAGSAVNLLPFFLIGYLLNRHRALADRRWALVIAPPFLLPYGMRLGVIFDIWRPREMLDRTIGLCVGITGVMLLFLARNLIRCRPLAWIGGFAFGIYLLHVFGAAAARMAAHHLGISADIVVFGISLAAGVVIPILFQRMFGR
jgi:peptidoglycan/LPS O-acetylase OafA/YrhL